MVLIFCYKERVLSLTGCGSQDEGHQEVGPSPGLGSAAALGAPPWPFKSCSPF